MDFYSSAFPGVKIKHYANKTYFPRKNFELIFRIIFCQDQIYVLVKVSCDKCFYAITARGGNLHD